MDVSRSRSKSYDASVSARLGLFVAPSLQDEAQPAPESDKGDVRDIVSRRVDQSLGGLRKRLALEEEAAGANPEYIVDTFVKRGQRRGPAAARRN